MFGDFDDIFGNMNRMMSNMNNMMNNMMNPAFGLGGPMMGNPNGLMIGNGLLGNHMQSMNSRMNNQLAMFGNMGPQNMTSFSMSSMPGQAVSYSSKVMTISNDGSGRPQVYEKTSSQVCGPNGVRETKETLRDSRTGVQEIKVGRHIHDKGHLKAKKRNVYNGEESEEEELVNLDEDEVEKFNNEFVEKTKDYRQKYQSIQSHPSNHTGRHRLALTNGAEEILQQQQPCSSQQQLYNLQQQDTRPPSRGKKIKDSAEKKLKKKSKKPY